MNTELGYPGHLGPPFKVIGAPYMILGEYYVPSKGHYASKMAAAILDLLKPFKLIPKLRGLGPQSPKAWGPQMSSIWASWDDHAEVRRYAQPDGQGQSWHKDGDMDPDSHEIMDHAAVLWSEVTPTEFFHDGTVWRPDPGQIVIARNLGCDHRSPPDTPKPPERRWFFRQRVEVPEWLS